MRNAQVILSNLRVKGPNILAKHILMRQFPKNRIGHSMEDRVCLGATRLIGHYRPCHTLRWCIPTMGCSKDIRCIFHVGNFAPDFGISQIFLFQSVSAKWLAFEWPLCHIWFTILNEISIFNCSDENHRRILKYPIVSSRLATLWQFHRRYLPWSAIVCHASRGLKITTKCYIPLPYCHVDIC